MLGLRNLYSGHKFNLMDAVEALSGHTLAAVTGLGQPNQFFEMLRAAGFVFTSHTLPDHQPLTETQLQKLKADKVLVTDKDAVKLDKINDSRLWVVEVEALLPPLFFDRLIGALPPPGDSQLGI